MNNNVKEGLEELATDAAELTMTHGGKHPQHITELVEVFKEEVITLGLSPTLDTFRAFYEGAKMYGSFEKEGEGFKLLASLLVTIRAMKKAQPVKKVEVKSDKKVTKVVVKKPVKSSIQPKEL